MLLGIAPEGEWVKVPVQNGVTPLQLAVLMKKFTKSGYRNFGAMKDVCSIIVSHSSESSDPFKPPMCPVPSSVIATLKNLLFSQDFSDVVFVCHDGIELPAHKNVLAAASEYFHAYFLGPWGDNHPDGKWETTNSSKIMKAVLTYIYTGELSSSIVDSNAHDLLRIAQEYNLPELLKLAEGSCIHKLSIDNIKDFLQLAHLHQSAALENACFSFVQDSAAECMMDAEFMDLAMEDPGLWVKLSKAVAPDNKRKRT